MTYPGWAAAHPADPGPSTTRGYGVGSVDDTDELDHQRTTHRDAFGRVSSIDEHARTCYACQPSTHTTSYRYDATDRLTGITDADGNVTTITRDAVGRKIKFDDPDRGTTNIVYRSDGTIDTETRPDSTTTYTYDRIGRISSTTVTGATGTTGTIRDYDVDPATHQPQGDSIGRPTRTTYRTTAPGAAAVIGTDRTWYDLMGRPNHTFQCVDSVCDDMRFTYDPAGRLDTLDYPNPGAPTREIVPYTYDPSGRLTAVGGFLTDIGYDATGDRHRPNLRQRPRRTLQSRPGPAMA